MSAIAGMLRLDGDRVARGCVERLTAAMRSSAPDGAAHWYGGPVALGHGMLRTTREAAAEVQPLEGEQSGVVLVVDGRLDNRDELARTLRARGALLRTETDAELILRAYEAWGEGSPEHLLGDFACAIWDGRRQRLFCAVDSMGACQIYYTQTDSFFAFASTEEALLALPEVSSDPNEELIATLRVPGFTDFNAAHTWLRQVKVMLPGQKVSLGPGRAIEFKTYWNWDAGEDLQFDSEAEARTEFSRVFGQAVSSRLRAAGSIAQMLSGGLDSASVRTAVGQVAPQVSLASYRTYSAVSDDPETCVETQCIKSLAQKAGAHFVAVPSFTGMVSTTDLVQEAWSLAHPCDNAIMLPALMCLAASRNGDRVMLHGASGDITLHVPDRYPAYMLRAGWWLQAWAECRHAGRNNTYLLGSRATSLFLLNCWTAAAPVAINRVAQRMRGPREMPALSAVNPDFALRLHLKERVAAQVSAQNRALSCNLQEDQAKLLRGPHAPVRALAGYMRVGRRYGMEMRDPWADRRVVEFFLRLPLQFKVSRGWTKYMVRSSLQGLVAPQVQWRLGKEHLGWQFTRRLMAESHDFIAARLTQDMDLVAPYVRSDLVVQRLKAYLAAPKDVSPHAEADQEFIYEVMTLALWLRRLQNRMQVG